MIALAVVGLLTLPSLAPQAPQGQVQPSSKSSSTKSLVTWPDRLAKQKVKDFEKALKPKKVSMGTRKAALSGLEGGISAHLVKPLQRFIETDSSVVLKRAAVEMLGEQPDRQAKKAVLKLLRNARVTGNPQVQAGLIRALGKAGYTKKDWKAIGDIFESDYGNERIPVHEAILDLVKAHKEQQAIPMLLNNMDEPSASNVDAADNPPREYWKARWHAWATWKAKVKDATKAITGQDFGNAGEARAWLKKNRLR